MAYLDRQAPGFSFTFGVHGGNQDRSWTTASIGNRNKKKKDVGVVSEGGITGAASPLTPCVSFDVSALRL